MMEPITSFDEWVRQQRKALDMTQAQLAEQVGCALITIKKIEQATRRPSRQMAELLAEALAVPETQRDSFLRLARNQYVEPSALPPSTVETSPPPPTISPQTIAEDPVLPSAVHVPGRSRPFVARERQMTQLETHLTGALNGSGRIAFIAGEAGYGKTMLMTEFARYALAKHPDLIVAHGNCDAYAGAGNPYLPFREIMALLTGDFAAYAGAPHPAAGDEATAATVPATGELSTYVGPLSQDQARRLWSLLPYTTQILVDQGPDLIDVFVSGAPLQQRIQTHPLVSPSGRAALEELIRRSTQPGNVRQSKLLEQYVQMLRALAARQPLLLLLDDLQWIDRASAELLFHAARRLSGCRILFLATYRRSEIESRGISSQSSAPANGAQEQAHPITPLRQELQRHYGDIEIDLDQLPPQMGRTFVDALLDSEPNQLAERFRAALFQRTQGHPLFTVELLQELQERGDLVRDEQGRWREHGAIVWQGLPARVEAVISQRIGRLPAILQEALKIASVEGETFTAEVVAHILGLDGWRMVQQLSSVAGRQHYFVASQGSQRVGNQPLSRYRFAHILFQTYLYTTLDIAERAYLHEAVGNALEQLAADQTEAVAVQLAHHFQTAGLTAKAIHYLHQAGRQAVALSAHQEAITHLTRALSLLVDLPENTARARLELQLQTDLGVSLKITKGFAAPEVEQVYLRAQALCEQIGEPLPWASVLWGLHSVYTVRGDLESPVAQARTSLALAQKHDDPVLHVTGHCTNGCTFGHMGHLNVARSHLEQAWSAYAAEQHTTYIYLAGLDLGVFTRSHLAHYLSYLGYPDQALAAGQEAVQLAQTLSHPFTHASALSYLTMLHQLRHDWRAVQVVAETAYRLCVEHDIPYYLAWTTFLQGWALVAQNSLDRGVAQMEQSLADLQAIGSGLRVPYYQGRLAEVYGQVGRIGDELHLVQEGLAQAHKQRQLLYAPELLRVQGDLMQMQQAPDGSIESSFRQAIELAEQQEAKLSELQAATSLARLYQRQGKRIEAHQALAGVVDWFSEGLETADLQEARTLLAALA